MQGRFKRDSGAAGDPEQQPGTTGNGQAPTAADSGGATPGPTAATGRTSTPSGIDAGRITGLAGKPGPRIAMRNWRISTRLVSLLALPVITAGTLGGLRINSSLDNVNELKNMQTLTDLTEHAVDLADALQDERDSSAGPMTQGHPNDDAVTSSRQTTDLKEKAYHTASELVQSKSVFSGSGVRSSLLSIDTQLTSLAALRDSAYSDDSSISGTVSAYDGLIQSLLKLTDDMAQATNNKSMVEDARALAAFSSAKEYESIQRAVISAALADTKKLAENHGMSASDYQSVKWASTDEDGSLTIFRTIYGTASVPLLAPLDGTEGSNDTITQHDKDRTRIVASQSALASMGFSYRDWDDNAKTKIQAMNQIERSLLSELQQRSLKLQKESKQSALISGAIILLVLGIAVVGAFIVGRSMVRSLRRLQQTAQDVAQKRLPELVKQLSDTDPQDVDTSVESIGINSRDEIGQVARAFDEVHSEAVRLAAEQALLRGNVNAMFTNLSRRSQGLIQRQLSLISELESREADPDQLSSLFKLDHLATRMRRNGENLLVLAGEEPGRRWTRPVPLVDVLRAAASEVEQYERIELTSVPSAEVTGRIVNDLVHLLAELLENATSFSSPQTKVRVTGHALPDGRVLIEIHDTGIGLSPEDLADINERLANPPTVDVSVSRRMGLFVVGRLSLRHGIRIQLRPSDSGGTTALVMLPVDLTQGGGAKNVGNAGRPGATPPPAAAGSTGIAGAFGNSPQVGKTPQRSQVGGGAARPALAAGGGRGGGAPQQPGAPRWAAQDGGQGFPDDRGMQDTPRGHEEVDDAPAFDAFEGAGTAPAPGQRADFQQGPGDLFGGRPNQGQNPGQGQNPNQGQGNRQPGQFPPPQPQSTGPSGFRSDVFGGRPGPTPRQGQGAGQGAQGGARPGGPGETAEFPAIRDDFGQQGGGNTGQFPIPQQGGGAPRGGRGPQETYSTGQFPVPGQGGGPGDTGQFPIPQPPQGGQGGQGENTGQFQGPGSTGQFPAVRAEGPGSTGQFPAVQAEGPGSTGQFPAVSSESTGEFRAPGQPGQPGGPGQFQNPGGLPQRGPRGPQGTPGYGQNGRGAPQESYDTGQHPLPGGGRPGDGTGQFAMPGQGGDQGTGQYSVPQPPQPQRPEPPNPLSEPMALPPAPTRGDEPTPIFASIESDWFRTGQAERMQQIHVEQSARGQQAPPPRPVGRTAPPQRPRTDQRPGPQRPGTSSPQHQPAPAPAPASAAAPAADRQQAPAQPQPLPRETPNWRSSPNDALRQRAEQVREPSAGGVTPSGLPRRVPRANLVPGGAAQPQAPQGGPQVSRSPDDVRGRLTNLRRGIQQGREAGGGNTDDRGFGTNHQER
ncbi:nitrate- and nitrite sensing domain-containing protein [Streptomyces sp. CA-111067]|uniref:sensor histidine kinase n=1 Tax=Streptomyces sp. CA-111067 TaxID=3240046 RepID=UPI003D988A48